MAIPAWFDPNTYFDNKLVQLGGTAAGWDSLTLRAAFNNAGYTGDEGLYQHFVDYGAREGVSPNTLFNSDEYLYSKAVEYYHTSAVTENHIASMRMLFEEAGVSAWEHYVGSKGWDAGAFEQDDNGNYTNNPSANFWTNQYMKDKLALWNAESEETHTMADLEAALIAAGLTPLEHYLLYGQDEGLVAAVAPTGRSFTLTAGDDLFLGTAGNDYFYGRINTLQDGDFINGGAGANDTLYAHLTAQNGQNAIIQPWIWNVENIIFRVQASGSNPGNLPQAQVDAGDILGMTYLKNDNSRATLSVEDVRTNSDQMTIAWADSDPGRMVDFEVYFDAQHLKPTGATSSGTLRIELMDVKNSVASGVHSLQENIWNTFSFTYTASDGSVQEVSLTADSGYTGADATIQTLLAAFQADLAASQWAGLFTLSLESDTYTGVASSGGQSWTFTGGHRIVITAANGTLLPVQWSTDGESTVPPSGGISWGYLEASQSTCPLITTTIELDNVGRVQWTDRYGNCLPDESIWGSESGDMIVGSMADRGGIERFDVKVDRGSWLSSLSSTNETLRMVTVEHRDINGDGKAGYNELAHANDEGRGQLYIGQSLAASADDNLMSWTDRATLLNVNGLVDVKNFEAGSFEGKLNIGASITEKSFEKYLDDVDGQYSMANLYAPRGDFLYDFGSNDDTLNMTVKGGIAADQDFRLVINGNNGNDFVNFSFADLTVNQTLNVINGSFDVVGAGPNPTLINHDRVLINGGDGNDVIKFWGDGAVKVTGGNGDDAIYVGQNGEDQNAVFLFNVGGTPTAAERAIKVSAVDGAQPLNNDILGDAASFAVGRAAGAAAQVLQVQVTFKGMSIGWFDVANIPANSGTAASNYSITAEAVNEAIAAAIANNTYMKNLIVAKDGAGHSLMIESLVDGLLALTDINIAFQSVLASDGTAGANTFADLTAAYTTNKVFAHDGTADVAGTIDGSVSFNYVDAGAGNDTVVLNVASGSLTPETDIDVLTISGAIGNDWVLNFDTAVDKFHVDSSMGTFGEGLAAIAVGANSANWTDANWDTVVAAINAGTLFDVANAKGVGYFVAGSHVANAANTYVFFQVQNDATAEVVRGEVTILGTMTFDNDTTALPATSAQFV